VSRAQARAAGVMDRARPSWFWSLPSRSAQIHFPAWLSPALSFFPLSGGRRVSRAQARAAGVMDRARPSWFMHLLYPSWCFMHLLVSLSVFFLPFN
jgi:hypothetical protein